MGIIDPKELACKPFQILDEGWALLVAGAARPNPMTVSWGGLGTLWNKPLATVYVRPTRHTFSLLNAEPEFTLNFLPAQFKPALDICGSRSGRDLDKWEKTGLTREPSGMVKVPRVAQASLSLECRVIYSCDLDPSRFLDPSIEQLYPARDYHRAFFGEVVRVWST